MRKKIKNRYHREIWTIYRKIARPTAKSGKRAISSYLGTVKLCYLVSADAQRVKIKEWIQCHAGLSQADFEALVLSLCCGESINEISIAGDLLRLMPEYRKRFNPEMLAVMLDHVDGWAGVDNICQSKFTASELLLGWKKWKTLINKLAKDPNIHKRRASLVLLTRGVRDSSDRRLSEMAFRNIGRLKMERHILITKAVSWLLRDMIKNHRESVKAYLDENENTLPRIAVRETRRKLSTGRK